MKVVDLNNETQSIEPGEQLAGCVRAICEASADALSCAAQRVKNPQVKRTVHRVEQERLRLAASLQGDGDEQEIRSTVGPTCQTYRAFCKPGCLDPAELEQLIQLDHKVAQRLRTLVREVTETEMTLKLSSVLAEFQMTSDELRSDVIP